MHDGLKRMYEKMEHIYYYITVMNENYTHPAMPKGAEADILKGMYLFREGPDVKKPRVQLMGSGTIFREVIAAAELLELDWGVASDVWSCTSFNELRRDGMAAERLNLLHPEDKPRAVACGTVAQGAQRPGHRLDRLHAHFRRPDPPLHATIANSPCSAPTALAARTHASSCANSSR